MLEDEVPVTIIDIQTGELLYICDCIKTCELLAKRTGTFIYDVFKKHGAIATGVLLLVKIADDFETELLGENQYYESTPSHQHRQLREQPEGVHG